MTMWREFIRIVKGTFTRNASVDSPRVERAAEQRRNLADLEERRREREADQD